MSLPLVVTESLAINASWLLITLGGTWGALALLGLLVEWIEARRQRRLEEQRRRDAEEAHYRVALDAAARIDASWPPPRVVRGRRS